MEYTLMATTVAPAGGGGKPARRVPRAFRIVKHAPMASALRRR
ncbi:MAG: hypothetical protein AAFQ88_02015 [Pseudomonadota bacterium]